MLKFLSCLRRCLVPVRSSLSFWVLASRFRVSGLEFRPEALDYALARVDV